MCSPMLVVAGATVLSGAMSAKASIDQGRYQRGVAEYNAAVDRNRAIEIKNKAIVQETEERQKAQQMSSRQRVIAASRGVEVGFGSPLSLIEDTERIGEINALRIRKGAQQQATALETQADLTESAGQQAQTQSRLGALSTVIGTGASVAGQLSTQPGKVAPKWYQFGKD